MGTKIKTQKNPWGLKTNTQFKKPMFNPKNPMLNFPTLKYNPEVINKDSSVQIECSSLFTFVFTILSVMI